MTHLVLLGLLLGAGTAWFAVALQRPQRSAWVLGLAGLGPLLLFGRAYAVVGVEPLYAPDACFITAAAVSTAVWIRGLSRSPLARRLGVISLTLLALASQAVVRGVLAGNEGALKGIILGLYPCLGLVAALFLQQQGARLAQASWVLALAPAGGVLAFAGVETVAAATGLYLAIAAAFATRARLMTGRWALAAAVLVSTALLAAATGKRGPALAVLCSIGATWLAARRASPRIRSARKGSLFRLVFLGLVPLLFAATLALPGSVPSFGVSSFVTRVEQTFAGGDTEAANNVAIRQQMWLLALKGGLEHPFVGVGAAQPLAFKFRGLERSNNDSGPHNSFFGYIYYTGFVSAGLVILIFLIAARSTWRDRGSYDYSPAIFGAIVGTVITCFSNVALETTYIGLVAWLVVMCAALGVYRKVPSVHSRNVRSIAASLKHSR